MKQLFEKIEIHSEEDLPKEDGEYLTRVGMIWFSPDNPFLPYDISEWMENIEYYLLPIESLESSKAEYDEDYLNECIEKAKPNLSKIKDVDKTLDEIRGVDSTKAEKKSAEDFPEIDFRRDIANELSRNELIERLCEMNKFYQEMRKEWFDKVILNASQSQVRISDKEIKNAAPYPEECAGNKQKNWAWILGAKTYRDGKIAKL